MFLEPLTITSVIVSSARSGSVGPPPGGSAPPWPARRPGPPPGRRWAAPGAVTRCLAALREPKRVVPALGSTATEAGMGDWFWDWPDSIRFSKDTVYLLRAALPSGRGLAAESARPFCHLHLFLFLGLSHQLVLDRPQEIEKVARRWAALIPQGG